MYCGSCMRDNALAAELMRRGHAVTLLPFYTPTLTDEVNVSRKDRVFFGGVSVYLEQHVPMFRKAPRLVERLLDAPPLIKALSSGSIAVDPHSLGAMTVSTLRGEQGHQRREIEKLIGFLAGEPRPDVISIPYTLLISLAAPLKRALGRPIVMTLQGEDLFLEGLVEPYKTEAMDLIRRQLGDVDLFVAVSDYYARFMQQYLGIPAARMRVAPLGISLADVPGTPAPLARDPFTIGFFARIAPEKGLHVLAETYRVLRLERGLPPSRLRAAGYWPPEHEHYLTGIQRRLEVDGLADEFEYAGAPDRAAKFRFLQQIDVLSVPSPYHEPKGLYLFEAMACGVPVVQPDHGAFPEIVRRTGGGLLARSNAPSDLADALMKIWSDPAAAAAMGRRGMAGVREHYTVEKSADAALRAFAELAAVPV
jgi:glycosyltransferase involved in cell wall biosynthesis